MYNIFCCFWQKWMSPCSAIKQKYFTRFANKNRFSTQVFAPLHRTQMNENKWTQGLYTGLYGSRISTGQVYFSHAVNINGIVFYLLIFTRLSFEIGIAIAIPEFRNILQNIIFQSISYQLLSHVFVYVKNVNSAWHGIIDLRYSFIKFSYNVIQYIDFSWMSYHWLGERGNETHSSSKL